LVATVAVADALKPRATFLLTKPVREEQFQYFDGRAGVVESLTIVGIGTSIEQQAHESVAVLVRRIVRAGFSMAEPTRQRRKRGNVSTL